MLVFPCQFPSPVDRRWFLARADWCWKEPAAALSADIEHVLFLRWLLVRNSRCDWSVRIITVNVERADENVDE